MQEQIHRIQVQEKPEPQRPRQRSPAKPQPKQLSSDDFKLLLTYTRHWKEFVSDQKKAREFNQQLMQNMMVAINKHEQTLQTKAVKALMISGLRSRDMA